MGTQLGIRINKWGDEIKFFFYLKYKRSRINDSEVFNKKCCLLFEGTLPKFYVKKTREIICFCIARK
jgi:hypothetical protein